MIKKCLIWLLFGLMVFSVLSCVVASPRMDPPPLRREFRTTPPGPGYYWISGHWAWRHGDWHWIRGHWTKQRPGRTWVPGHWERRGGKRVWIRGHWRKRRR